MSPIKKPQNTRQQWMITTILFLLLIGIALFNVNGFNLTEDAKLLKNAEEVPLSEITAQYNKGTLKEITVKDSEIVATTNSGDVLTSYKERQDSVSELGWNDPRNPTTVTVENLETQNLITSMIPDILFFLLIIGGLLWLFRGVSKSQNNALSFGKSKARTTDPRKVTTRFKDVAGADEAKEDLEEVVDFLKNPKRYQDIGAKIPKGVLMVGAPGTGKTLMARAVAGEAKVPFFSIAGSEFVEMFVGVGASRVRDLFAKAKRNAPCIIFIDEIDAVGRQRGGAGFGGGHDEREQTLNQILTEMDGFEQGTNVIVIAATNRPDVLDKALLRPGRVDWRVFIDRPDLAAREKVLEVHSRNKKMGKKIDLHTAAKQTIGMTGADLENVMNEAAILAARNHKKTISQNDIIESIEKVTVGAAKKSRTINEKEKLITAYHEMGHAIVGYLSPESDDLHKISIVSRGSALGVTWFLPSEDQFTTSKEKFLDQICGLLGGRAAEEIMFKQITTGASNDIEKATKIARNMAMKYGMGGKSLGMMAYGEKEGSMFLGTDPSMNKNYSEEQQAEIDEFVRTTIDTQYKKALTHLKKHKKKLVQLTEQLLEDETMSREEFIEMFDPSPLK